MATYRNQQKCWFALKRKFKVMKVTELKIDLMAIEDRNIFNAFSASASVTNAATAATNNMSRNSMIAALSEIGKWDKI